MTRFHINKRGDAAPCFAEKNCPLGGDHFDTKGEASRAYEAKMTAELLPTGVSKDASKSALNELAKFSDDPEVVARVAAEGSERALKNLARNKWADPVQLMIARDRAQKLETRRALATNPNFPLSAMDGGDLNHVLSQKDVAYGRVTEILEANEFGDEHMAAVTEHSARLGLSYRLNAPLSNGANRISPEVRAAHAERSWPTLGSAMKSNAYPAERIKDLDASLIYWGNVKDTSNPEYLAGHVAWAENNPGSAKAAEVLDFAAKNPATDAATLAKIHATRRADQAIFDHPNTSDEVRAEIVGSNRQVASVAKVRALDETYGGNLKGQITKANATVHPFGVNRGMADTTVQFDTAKVASLGLDERDIHNIMGTPGHFNGGASYDATTGVFKGTVDSTG